MEIKEISQILPPLKVESVEGSAYEREFFTNPLGRKVYVSEPRIDRDRQLMSWIETEGVFSPSVMVKIYQYGSINRLLTQWHIFPVKDFCLICYVKFFSDALVIIWRDNDCFHLVNIGLPEGDLEAEISMMRLGPMVHLCEENILSYRWYDAAPGEKAVQRLQLPERHALPPLSLNQAHNLGIELSEYWEGVEG